MENKAVRALASVGTILISGFLLASPEGVVDSITKEQVQNVAVFGFVVALISLMSMPVREDHTLRTA